MADALVRAGFRPAIRQSDYWESRVTSDDEELAAQWSEVYQHHLARLASRLTAWPLQLLLNAPIIGMLGWVCVQTVYGFFAGNYLAPEYFRHAAIATGTIWALSFVLFQVIASISLRRTVRLRITRDLVESLSGVLIRDLRAQLDDIEQLG
jgi:hypothetical protein